MYQLSRRYRSGVILGLSTPQVMLLVVGVAAVLLLPGLLGATAGLTIGCTIAFCCAGAALFPVEGRPLHVLLSV